MKVGILCLVISFFLYYKIELKKIRFFDINSEYLVNILVLIFIFYVWFDYHPRLRYGGYLICLILGSTIIIPLIHNFFKLREKNLNLLKVFCILIFIGKIIFSINYIYKYKDNFENFPFYNVSKPTFKVKNYNDNFSINYSLSTYCVIHQVFVLKDQMNGLETSKSIIIMDTTSFLGTINEIKKNYK